jgi:hypothetical protein
MTRRVRARSCRFRAISLQCRGEADHEVGIRLARYRRELKQRKVANLQFVGADVAATGNIGCMTQLSGAIGIPMVHTVELLEWVTGGLEPEAMRLTVAMPKGNN